MAVTDVGENLSHFYS